MFGLVKHHVVCARYGHHDHESPSVILHFAVELCPFTLQFNDRLRDVVAHQGDQMMPRRFVRLAIVDAVGRMHAHFALPGLEDEPALASTHRILDVGPAEYIAKERARCRGIVGVNQGVDTGDHQTDPIIMRLSGRFCQLAITKQFIVPEIRTPSDCRAVATSSGSGDCLLVYTHRKTMRATVSISLVLAAVSTLALGQSASHPTSSMTKSKSPTPAEVHRSAIVIDTHADTPQRFVDENFDLGDPLNGGNFNLESARKGNLGAEFFSIWVDPNVYKDHEARRTLVLIDAVKQQVAKHPDQMEFVTSPAGIEQAHRDHKLAVADGHRGRPFH